MMGQERERKPSVFVSEDRKIWALAEIENGRSVSSVARELGVTAPTVFNWRRYFQECGKFSPSPSDLRARTLERPKELEASMQAKAASSYTREDRVRIVTAYEDGDMTAREIRERYGVPHGDLLAWREQVTADEPSEDLPAQTTMWEPASVVNMDTRATKTTHPDTEALGRAIAENVRLRGELDAAKKRPDELAREAARAAIASEKTSRELSDAREQLRSLRETVGRLQKERDDAIEARDAMRDEAKSAISELEEQRASCERLRELLAEAEQKAGRAGGAGAEAEALRADNEKLRQRVKMLAQMLGDA